MSLAIALIQTNFTVGYISGNVTRITGLYEIAKTAEADLVIFSEMAITGYPAEDLVLRTGFQQAAMQAVEELAILTKNGPAMLVGGLWAEEGRLYNTIFLLEDGNVLHRQYKHHLPNYGVFDEKRVFVPGPMPMPCLFRGIKLGFLICEDMWERNVAAHLKAQGAELLISINASPYEIGKAQMRNEMSTLRTRETHLPLIYVNQVGGQDELVFDGGSYVCSAQGDIRAKLRVFQEDISLTIWDKTPQGMDCAPVLIHPEWGEEETIYRAMMLGLRDFVAKNGFSGVVLGLSGGIDSALTAAVAADALGSQNVRAVMLPSPYTSRESLDDAQECAKLLGIRLDSVAIEPAMQAMSAMLSTSFSEPLKEVTQENIQPRLRGAILMALSNNDNLMLLTTGNKSEMSVGYATLYGDMCGGFNVIKDIYKTTVYKLSRWRNTQGRVIPERILTKAPTAELKPNQTDQDSLPPYELLDSILFCFIENALSVEEIIAQGYPRETVEKVAKMLYLAEYKRRQAPPGIKITLMAFGRDRRYPITNGWRK